MQGNQGETYEGNMQDLVEGFLPSFAGILVEDQGPLSTTDLVKMISLMSYFNVSLRLASKDTNIIRFFPCASRGSETEVLDCLYYPPNH